MPIIINLVFLLLRNIMQRSSQGFNPMENFVDSSLPEICSVLNSPRKRFLRYVSSRFILIEYLVTFALFERRDNLSGLTKQFIGLSDRCGYIERQLSQWDIFFRREDKCPWRSTSLYPLMIEATAFDEYLPAELIMSVTPLPR